MNASFYSKLGLYDFLVIFIPGCALGYLLSFCKPIEWLVIDNLLISRFFDDIIVRNVLFVVFAYLLGLLNHSLQNTLWPVLRNYGAHIDYVKGDGEQRGIDGWINCPCLIFRGIALLVANIVILLTGVCSEMSVKEEKSYLEMYYKAEKRPRSSIGYIEYQVLFIRNLLPSLIISCCMVNNSSFIIVMVIYFLMIERQEKIYKSVIEDATYYTI